MQTFDVIIIGGGPTGVALGIELGLHNINTLVLEKHAAPLLSPRAQFINARSMEFFSRWNIAENLRGKQLFPYNFPLQQVWCSQLKGKTYAISNPNELLNDALSPEQVIQIPLWLTEETLRVRLQNFSTVTFLKNQTAEEIGFNSNTLTITTKTELNQHNTFHTRYLVACDGTNSFTRNKLGISFDALAPPRRVMHVMFESQQLQKLLTVEKGVLYYILESANPGGLGIVDLARGLWHAQIRGDVAEDQIDQVNLDTVLNEMVGFQFEKKIIQAHFWNMHSQIATQFTKDNRIFLVGDSAHAFSPIGSLGLNTGFGDVVNLGWKLAAVIHQHAAPALLETYEQERRPICLNNLLLAQKNADGLITLRRQYDPRTDAQGYAQALVNLAKQINCSLGATMGYAYFDSTLTLLQKNQLTNPMNAAHYQPTLAPGYFLPHCWIAEKTSIYSALSPTHWTLIICENEEEVVVQNLKRKFADYGIPFKTLSISQSIYPNKYILIRPDWHIVWTGHELDLGDFEKYLVTFQQCKSLK
jgi:2-polyprenyl-6-methoxyphenol hydroxylase-like FAD-dependent oxidoreductase